MEFFPYKSFEVSGLKTGRTRFAAIVFNNQIHDIPGCDLWRQIVTLYEDGREIVDQPEKISLTMSNPEILNESFPLYHPLTGEEIGGMTFGELAGVVYSAAIAIDKKQEIIITEPVTSEPVENPI